MTSVGIIFGDDRVFGDLGVRREDCRQRRSRGEAGTRDVPIHYSLKLRLGIREQQFLLGEIYVLKESAFTGKGHRFNV